MRTGRQVKIKQRDVTDCGPSCLASVASYYGLGLPVSKIRQMVSTDARGSNLVGMSEAAKELGFAVKAVRCDPGSLTDIPLPAIAHVVFNKSHHHFVVLYRAGEKRVKIMDPSDGRFRTIPVHEFGDIWTGVLLLLVPDDHFRKSDERVPVLSRLLFLLKPHRNILLQILFGAVIFTILGLSTAIFVQLIVDYVLQDANQGLLNLAGAGMVVILLARLFIGVLKTLFTIRTGQLIDARLILGYYKHLVRLPQSFFDSMQTGEIISRINDAVKIRLFINEAGIQMAVNICTVIASFALMFTWYWKLGLVMALVIPFYLAIYMLVNRLNRKTQRSLMERAADLESQLVTSLRSMPTIKVFGLEAHAGNRTERSFIKLLQRVYESGKNSIFSSYSTRFISDLFTIILLWTGSWYVLQGLLSPGELLSFYAVTGYFTGPVNETVGMNRSIQDAMIAADRLFEVMDLDQESRLGEVPVTRPMTGPIRFEDVHFRYGSRATVFDGLTLSIHPGEVTALVGENGSGKTTVMKLFMKLYPLDSGRILLDGNNLSQLKTEDIRAMTAVVPQHLDLFPGDLIENIAVGDREPDIKRIDSLCHKLGMRPFIESLPDGYSTWLGENGALISGGQRQRLAIARALYRNPDIIFFDEATSSLDSRSAQYIHRIIQILKKRGKTVVTISHRLSGLKDADKICLLKDGRLAEEGSHDVLLDLKGEYYRLWIWQHASGQRAVEE